MCKYTGEGLYLALPFLRRFNLPERALVLLCLSVSLEDTGRGKLKFCRGRSTSLLLGYQSWDTSFLCWEFSPLDEQPCVSHSSTRVGIGLWCGEFVIAGGTPVDRIFSRGSNQGSSFRGSRLKSVISRPCQHFTSQDSNNCCQCFFVPSPVLQGLVYELQIKTGTQGKCYQPSLTSHTVRVWCHDVRFLVCKVTPHSFPPLYSLMSMCEGTPWEGWHFGFRPNWISCTLVDSMIIQEVMLRYCNLLMLSRSHTTMSPTVGFK